MINLLVGDREILNEVEEITNTSYQTEIDKISQEELWNALTDLLSMYKQLEDVFRRFEQDVNDNYKAIMKEEQING